MKKGQHCSPEFRKILSDLAIGRESQTKGRKLKTKNRYSEIGKEVVRVPSQEGFKTFFKFGIEFILPAGEIEREDKIKRGDWQCDECNRWHKWGEKCGCQGGKF